MDDIISIGDGRPHVTGKRQADGTLIILPPVERISLLWLRA